MGRLDHGRGREAVLTDLVAAASYAGVVAAAGYAAWTGRSAEIDRRRRGRQVMIGGVLATTLLAGLSQRDLWPLSSWSLMTRAPRRDMGVNPVYLRLVAVDSAGAEYTVDYRAVEPFAIEELMAWMRAQFVSLPRAEQDTAARYLLGRVNAARARVREGRSAGTAGVLPGALRAPFHQLHQRRWRESTDLPATPFVTLRLYGETWDLEERARDSTRVSRHLLYQLQAP